MSSRFSPPKYLHLSVSTPDPIRPCFGLQVFGSLWSPSETILGHLETRLEKIYVQTCRQDSSVAKMTKLLFLRFEVQAKKKSVFGDFRDFCALEQKRKVAKQVAGQIRCYKNAPKNVFDTRELASFDHAKIAKVSLFGDVWLFLMQKSHQSQLTL